MSAMQPMGTSMEPTLLISGVSALLRAIDTWVKYQDSRRAAEAFRIEKEASEGEPGIAAQARVLASVVPADVLDVMTERAEKCWTKYKDVLTGEYLPGEVDDATEAVKACVCRELRRIKNLGEPIPQGKLSEWWDRYCQGK